MTSPTRPPDGRHAGSTTAARHRFRRAAVAVLTGLELLCLTPAAVALPGQLDPSFAGDGTRTLLALEEAQDVLVQPDGKIVAAGGSRLDDLAVARLHPDGTLDTSFDDDGLAVVDFGGIDSARAVALQPDGRIVVVGFTTVGRNGVVARQHPNGALDTSFHPGGPDGDGKRTIDYGGNDDALDVVVQPDGRIVVAGLAGPNTALAVTRLEANGADDPSFDGDGTAGVDDGAAEYANAVALQPDGRIVAAGGAYAGSDSDVLVARFNPTGAADMTLDPTFGSGSGWRRFGYGGADAAGALLVQPDGKLVVAGSGGPFTALAVTRLDPGGAFDGSFDGDGIAGADFGGVEQGKAALLQPDGKIVVIGYTTLNQEIAVARFNVSGPADMTLDTSFSADGKTTVSYTEGSPAYAYAAALQADGKIVIAGQSPGGALVVRLQGDPPPAPPPAPGNGSGGGPGPGGGAGSDPAPPGGGAGSDPAPRISRLSLTRARLAVTGRRRGTRIRFTLSEPAAVTMTIERATAGRRVRGDCRPAGRSNRRAPRCTLWRRAGRLELPGRQGVNSKRFSGTLAGRPLASGRYRLRLIAVDAASQRSRPRSAHFTVLASTARSRITGNPRRLAESGPASRPR